MRTTIFAAGLAGLAAANAMVKVVNQCDMEVFMVTSDKDSETEPQGGFTKGGNYATAYEEGQHEIKISPDWNAYENAGGQTGLVYTVQDDEITFDLYNVFGSDFNSLIVEAEGDDDCEAIVWDNGQQPAGSQSRTCKSEASITLTLCGVE